MWMHLCFEIGKTLLIPIKSNHNRIKASSVVVSTSFKFIINCITGLVCIISFWLFKPCFDACIKFNYNLVIGQCLI